MRYEARRPCLSLALVGALFLRGTLSARGTGILTPPPPPTPRINGARVYGERPGRPFQFSIPATGRDPLTYSAIGLPPGLTLNPETGRISGSVNRVGAYPVRLTAANRLGTDSKTLLIRIGDQICLTPPMGWNSWNVFGHSVNEAKVRAQAEAMVKSGLIKHGWTYVNIDDTWQGARDGKSHALQGNQKFPNMKGLCDEIHALGLKAGIYSTPWVTSYAGFPGGSSENPDGAWTPFTGVKRVNKNVLPFAEGPYSFARADAQQWADWGFDYLKYDWNPVTTRQVKEMGDALNATGRDFVYSLSNSAPYSGAADWARLANAWRTTGDIRDNWQSVCRNGFSQTKWAPYAGPGHWNDPDMLVVGMVGWGAKQHLTHLTHDEQYSHISLWCLLAAPLILGCDLTRLDDFTLNLLTNDEVLAIDQDPRGAEATRVSEDLQAGTEVWARPLSDGTFAVGLFNRGRYVIQAPRRPRKGETGVKPVWKLVDRSGGPSVEYASAADADAALQKTARPTLMTATWAELGLSGRQPVRDLWRQKDLAPADGKVTLSVPFHGVALLRIGTPRQ